MVAALAGHDPTGLAAAALEYGSLIDDRHAERSGPCAHLLGVAMMLNDGESTRVWRDRLARSRYLASDRPWVFAALYLAGTQATEDSETPDRSHAVESGLPQPTAISEILVAVQGLEN